MKFANFKLANGFGGVVVLVLAVIVLLQYRAVLELRASVDRLTAAVSSVSEAHPLFNSASSVKNQARHSTQVNRHLLDQIRRIVRSELHVPYNQPGAADSDPLDNSPDSGLANQSNSPPDPINRDAMKLLVTQRLDEYLSSGYIPEDEMENLLKQMAQLAQSDRQTAFTRLVQAMNNGSLEAHF